MLISDKSYVPILKTKAGERWAISNLKAKTRGSIIPLLEIHEHSKNDIEQHAASICDDLAAAWGTTEAFYLDTLWLDGSGNDPRFVETIYEAMASFELQAMPVARLDMEEACLERIGAVIADSGSGGMLRVRHQDLKRLDRIPAVLTSLATSQEHVDLLIDHRSANMTTLSDDLESVPDLMAWRTLIAASGTFPRSYPINKGVNGSI